MAHVHGLGAQPHEFHDTGTCFAGVVEKLADGVAGQGHARVSLGQETVVVGLFQLAVFDAGVADPQDGDAVELQRIVLVIYFLEVGKDVLEQPVAKRDVCPVLHVNVTHGHCRHGFFLRDVFPANNMAYRRSVFREVTAVHVLAADALAHGIMILVLAVADDYGVLWPLHVEDMSGYWHNVKI